MDNKKIVAFASETIRQATMKHDEWNYNDLQKMEKRRRAALRHNHEYFLFQLFHWDGTVFRLLVSDALLYATMLIYILVRVQARVGLPEFVELISGGDIAIVGGFLSFFLVVFVSQSNARFWDQYNHAMKLKGRVFDVASLARAYVPRARAHRIVRYMNASMIASFVGISSTYSSTNFFDPLNEIHKILTQKEVARMEQVDMNVGCAASRELLVWALMDIEKCEANDNLNSFMANQLREYVIDFRRSVGHLANLHDQPISFFYVHFLTLLSTFYLPLFAITVGYNAGSEQSHWIVDLVTALIVLLQAVFVIGLRLLGLNLCEPFGGDVEDLSVMHYINFTWKHSNRLLETIELDDVDETVENSIRRSREKLGDAWDLHGTRSIFSGKYNGVLGDSGTLEVLTQTPNRT